MPWAWLHANENNKTSAQHLWKCLLFYTQSLPKSMVDDAKGVIGAKVKQEISHLVSVSCWQAGTFIQRILALDTNFLAKSVVACYLNHCKRTQLCTEQAHMANSLTGRVLCSYLWEILQRATDGVSLVIWDHTVLHATRHRWTCPTALP